MLRKQHLIVFLILLTLLIADAPAGLADEEVSLSQFATPAPVVQSQGEGTGELSVAPTATPAAQPVVTLPDGTVQIVITAGGDMTIGGNTRKRGDSIFERELKKQGGDLNFITRNIKDILESDDMTLVNFEGTLTTAPVYKTKNDFTFAAPPAYVEILKNGSIEAVALENNHGDGPWRSRSGGDQGHLGQCRHCVERFQEHGRLQGEGRVHRHAHLSAVPGEGGGAAGAGAA